MGELFDLAAVDRLEQRFPGREVAIERSYADTGALGDRLEARLRAAGAEDARRRLEQALAIAQGIRAWLARGCGGTGGHDSSPRTPLAKRRVPPYISGGTLRIGSAISSVKLFGVPT